MKACVWLHGESLSPRDPALAAHPDAPAVFVFDEVLLARMQPSFKRLFFMYEGVVEAFAGHRGPTTIYRGDPTEVVLAVAREHGCDTVCVTGANVPGFAEAVARLEREISVYIYPMPDMMPSAGTNNKRATQFWRKHEAMAFEDSGSPDALDEADRLHV